MAPTKANTLKVTHCQSLKLTLHIISCGGLFFPNNFKYTNNISFQVKKTTAKHIYKNGTYSAVIGPS